jgi:hypothetical protein
MPPRPAERRAKTRPAIFAFPWSKASAPELHQKNMANPKNQNPWMKILTQGFWRSADFFGASPVASALDLRLGRDPVADRPQSSMGGAPDPPKRGTFYFAEKRNFLLCVDRGISLLTVRDARDTLRARPGVNLPEASCGTT